MTLPDDPRIHYAECDPSLCPCQRGLECDCEAGDEGERLDEEDESDLDPLLEALRERLWTVVGELVR